MFSDEKALKPETKFIRVLKAVIFGDEKSRLFSLLYFSNFYNEYVCSEKDMFLFLVRKFLVCVALAMGFPGDSDCKESACNARGAGLIPGLGGSFGEGNDNPLQYSCPENSIGRGA